MIQPEDFVVDSGNLTWEYERQSDLFRQVTELLSVAVRKRIIAEEDLSLAKKEFKPTIEEIKSKVELEIRQSDPAEYDLAKFTEGAITALINSDQAVVEATQEGFRRIETLGKKYALAAEEEENLKGMRDALFHKKDAVAELIRLWTQGLYQPHDDVPEIIEKPNRMKGSKNGKNR